MPSDLTAEIADVLRVHIPRIHGVSVTGCNGCDWTPQHPTDMHRLHVAATLVPALTAHTDAAVEGTHVRREWGVQKAAYPLGAGIRLYEDDEASAREAAPKVIGSGAYVVCREVVTSRWYPAAAQPVTEEADHG